MRVSEYINNLLKDTGDEVLNKVQRRLMEIGMGDLNREMDRADTHLFKTQFDNNLLVFHEALGFVAQKFGGASKTEADAMIAKLQEGFK